MNKKNQYFLIINADDFGYSLGINKGIIKACKKGSVTSTSVMIDKHLPKEDLKEIQRLPISLGLHFAIYEKPLEEKLMKKASLLTKERDVVSYELERQIKLFKKIFGFFPSHLDSHHHIHFHPWLYKTFEKLAQTLKVPFRKQRDVNFIDSFFGWDNKGKTDLKLISTERLKKILQTQLKPGINELMCHPGLLSPDLKSSYRKEREKELQTLTDPNIKTYLEKNKINLITWKFLHKNEN